MIGHCKKILIACDKDIGICRNRRRQYEFVIRISHLYWRIDLWNRFNVITPEQPLNFVNLLRWQAEFLLQHPPGFGKYRLTGKKVMRCQKKPNDIGTESSCRKAAYNNVRIEEYSHALDL